jgi:hypothetical protein
MDLETSLRAIQAVSDLPQLVGKLGHKPLWEPVPNEAWNIWRGRALHISAVGQTGDLPWFAVESRSPERDAVLLARRISRRGRAALVLAFDPAAHRLALAVAFARCPCLQLDLTNPGAIALAALRRLAGASEGGASAFAARVADVLSAEPVSRRFFREFRTTLEQMAAGLRGSVPEVHRQAIVLLQLTRVLFLYFVQTKGWLAGRDRFLAEEVDRCLRRKRRIHRDLLRPLFFGTLNQPIVNRGYIARKFGPIPFLNGGLFEPHPLERQYRTDLGNDLWCRAFDGLFERFHFTVSEGGSGATVAPDMLGRVFEGVMEPGIRRVSGTFYTPAVLVERLLDAALLPLVARCLSCTEEEAYRRLNDRDPDLAKILRSITLLDPAVGSGAFLLGALQRLSGFGPPEATVAERKRLVLQRNLFGVDRNAVAVRLTELRLWLAVVADDPADRPEDVHPLPNLDCLIRQGDSLFDPLGGELAGGHPRPTPEMGAELARLRHDIINAGGPHKNTLVRRLHAMERRALSHSLESAEQVQRSAVKECLQQARGPDLFGRRRGLDRQLRSRLDQLRSMLRGLRHARQRLAHEGELPWFHYQSQFADVFAHGGFDIVIGNPPWLRSELIPPKDRRQLEGRYRWWRRSKRTFGNSPDLAVAFLERAMELSGPAGTVAMLVPAKVITAAYGSVARHQLASHNTLHVVADLTGTPDAEFDATVYPLALVASKSSPEPYHRLRTALEPGAGSRVKQSELLGGAPWVLARPAVREVVATLEQAHPILGETIICHLGVKTGLNRVFLDPPPDLEHDVLRWAIRGRDVKPFRCQCRRRLLWTHDPQGHAALRLPPRVTAYLMRHEPALRARRDYRSGPPWVVFRTQPATARFRVVWPDLARRLTAVALTSRRDLERIPLNSCYVAPIISAVQADALAAWLNTTWIGAMARLSAVPAAGGFARFNAQVVSRLPCPRSALDDAKLAHLGRMGRSGATIQDEVDQLAAHHLKLSGSAQRALRAVADSVSCHSC